MPDKKKDFFFPTYLEAVLALAEVHQVYRGRPVALHVQAEVARELDVVHVDLLAEVALEGHVRLELGGQRGGVARQGGVEVRLQPDHLPGLLDDLGHVRRRGAARRGALQALGPGNGNKRLVKSRENKMN